MKIRVVNENICKVKDEVIVLGRLFEGKKKA